MESLCVTFDDMEDVIKFLNGLYWGDKDNSPFKVEIAMVSKQFEVYITNGDYEEVK